MAPVGGASATIPHAAPNHAEAPAQHRRRAGLAARAHNLARQAATTTEPSEPARLGGELAEAATATGDSPTPPTDLGNGERFAAQQAERARYGWPAGRWLVWNWTHWRPDAGGGVHELAAQTVRAIYAEASRATDDDRRRELGKRAARSDDRRRIAATLELAKSKVAVTADRLDFPEDRKRDSFGRLLAVVQVDGLDVGAELLRRGLAGEYRD